MNSIFYNIFSIIVGILVIGFGIMKHKQKLFVVIMIILHGLAFLGFGIYGFFVPKEYEYITILAMLAFTITLAITLMTIYDKKLDNNKSNRKVK